MNGREYFDRECRRLGAALNSIHRAAAGSAPDPKLGETVRAVRAMRQRTSEQPFELLPLEHAVSAFGLDELGRDALTLAAAVEASPDIAAAVRTLGGAPWPTIHLITAITSLGGDAVLPFQLAHHPAVADGLFDVFGDGPLPSRMVRVTSELAAVLAGASGPACEARKPDPSTSGTLIGPEARVATLYRWVDALPGVERGDCLLLVGEPGAGRSLWASAACTRRGWPLVVADVAADVVAEIRAARMWARWHGAALMLRIAPGLCSSIGRDHDAASRMQTLLRALRSMRQPVFVAATGADADILAHTGFAVPRIDIGELSSSLREQLWHRVLPAPAIDHDVIRTVAHGFALRSEQVARAARRIRTTDEIASVCRDIGAGAVGDLAVRLDKPFVRNDLVVPARIAEELELALAWAQRRLTVFDDWGFGRQVRWGRGVTALFAGKPGTGKTMAAQVLAAELGLDIYRIDLSRVVNKYVGETEKHLSRLFDEVGAAGAILFFDEADALFGRRSQVHDAHDRYANIEVGYLLQRIEAYEGVTILATNRHSDLDDAFLRRFQVALVFPMPDASDRLRLWRRAVPASAPQNPDLPLDQLARDYELSGGDIQMAALSAAFLAATECIPIGAYELYRGVHRVLVKNGVVPDERLRRIIRSKSVS